MSAPQTVQPLPAAPPAGPGNPQPPRPAPPELGPLLQETLSRKASDLHLSVGARPMLRVMGELVEAETHGGALSADETREIVYSILTGDQRQRLEEEWQIDFSYATQGARFRVNVYYQRASVGAALRLIPEEIPRFEDLGLPSVLLDFARKPRGFVLVTGPTGSGKSTTLASMIDLINKERREHILTIEDPIEFLHRHQNCIVNQRELGSDAKTFALALKAALRQDPDVVLVGEMRDLETMQTALTAAETGHLVFATLHTQDTAQTVDRIIDAFPAAQQDQVRVQLSVALQGIVTQSLLPRADGQGRVAACEVLVPTAGVRNLIREGKTHQIYSALQTGGQHGMQTMDAALADLVHQGLVLRTEAQKRAQHSDELTRLIGGTP